MAGYFGDMKNDLISSQIGGYTFGIRTIKGAVGWGFLKDLHATEYPVSFLICKDSNMQCRIFKNLQNSSRIGNVVRPLAMVTATEDWNRVCHCVMIEQVDTTLQCKLDTEFRNKEGILEEDRIHPTIRKIFKTLCRTLMDYHEAGYVYDDRRGANMMAEEILMIDNIPKLAFACADNDSPENRTLQMRNDLKMFKNLFEETVGSNTVELNHFMAEDYTRKILRHPIFMDYREKFQLPALLNLNAGMEVRVLDAFSNIGQVFAGRKFKGYRSKKNHFHDWPQYIRQTAGILKDIDDGVREQTYPQDIYVILKNLVRVYNYQNVKYSPSSCLSKFHYVRNVAEQYATSSAIDEDEAKEIVKQLEQLLPNYLLHIYMAFEAADFDSLKQ